MEWHYENPEEYIEYILAIEDIETGETWTTHGHYVNNRWKIGNHRGKYSAINVYAWTDFPLAPNKEE